MLPQRAQRLCRTSVVSVCVRLRSRRRQRALRYLGDGTLTATGGRSAEVSFGVVEPDEVSALASGFVREPLTAHDIAPGASVTLDLSNKIQLTGSAPQADLWAGADVRVFATGPVSASGAKTLTISVGSGAETLDTYHLVLIEITQEGLTPLWVGFLARVQPATATGGPQVTVPAELAGGAAFDAKKLVGANPEPLVEEAWFPEIERAARPVPITLSQETPEAAVATVSLSGTLDGTPEIAAITGDSGAALLVFPTDPGAESQAPQLPAATISQVETPDRWAGYPGLAEAEDPHTWRRCRASEARRRAAQRESE